MKFSDKEYEARIAGLYSCFQSVQAVGFGSGAYKPGLEGMKALSAATGDPYRRLRCIHVAGTNGKGSVSSMLASALANGGRNVGLYTSPHLVDFRERMRVVSDDGFELMPRESVWEFLESYEEAFEGRSFFEITTAMAFWWFARIGVDLAVIETGLGGRLDSTNIIAPELCVITSIGLDHCALLGDTRAAIAREKAGIFKPGAPAVVWGRDEETEPVFEEVAAMVGAPLHFASDFGPFDGEKELLQDMDLRGEYQEMNLHTVIAALHEIPDLRPSGSVRNDSLSHTASRTGLHGRWEHLCSAPEIICDIGHNPQALERNFAQLEHLRKGPDGLRPLIIVYGIMADKDLGSIIPMMPSRAYWIFAAPDSPRALPAEELLRRVLEARPGIDAEIAPESVSKAFPRGSVAAALIRARQLATADTIIYIGGSAFVVAEVLSLFN